MLRVLGVLVGLGILCGCGDALGPGPESLSGTWVTDDFVAGGRVNSEPWGSSRLTILDDSRYTITGLVDSLSPDWLRYDSFDTVTAGGVATLSGRNLVLTFVGGDSAFRHYWGLTMHWPLTLAVRLGGEEQELTAECASYFLPCTGRVVARIRFATLEATSRPDAATIEGAQGDGSVRWHMRRVVCGSWVGTGPPQPLEEGVPTCPGR
jgi:hypothetical protein